MDEIHAHSGLIDSLGGTTKAATAASAQAGLPLRPQTVSQWRKRGIAHPWRPVIASLARAAGVEVPPGFLLPPGPAEKGESHA